MKLMTLAAVLLIAAAVGCGGGDDTTDDTTDGTVDAPVINQAQTPPEGAAAVDAWLAAGSYKTWAKEAAIHESRDPSPHGFNRIYSNDILAANASGTGAWPEGAAAVKELYASTTATTPIGYAVYRKTAADSNNGANWYWYEVTPDLGVVADGKGGSGDAKAICVGCHMGAGSDAMHTPTLGGRDQVYTPVK